MRPIRLVISLLLVAVPGVGTLRPAWADAPRPSLPPGGASVTALSENDFEGDHPSWQPDSADTAYRWLRHERVWSQAHGGQRSELVRIESGLGSQVMVAHAVAPARVIDDLRPAVWIQSDRIGMQLFGRVVLPRTIDPATGRPAWILVPGTTLTAAGQWQQLAVEGLAREVQRQVRLLRLRLGPEADSGEAYLDRLVLNVYGGPGETSVWIDDLELSGFVPRSIGPASANQLAQFATGTGEPQRAPGGPPRPQIELEGTVLVINQRPFFPRVIDYRGEPLELLRNLGFNTIRTAQTPGSELLRGARRAGLWIVCPPPRPAGLEGEAPVRLAPLGEAFDGVLAWDMGSQLDRSRLPMFKRWVDAVREADQRVGRPIVCAPVAELRAYSRPADVLIFERGALGTSLELADYGTWLRERPRLARPGTPFWTAIQTQLPPALIEQLALLTDGGRRWAVEADSLRLLVQAALGAGARGLCFTSPGPLNATDPVTVSRALALERINLELQLIERWVASASYVASVTANVPQISAAILETDRTRLLLPAWSGTAAQLVPGQAAANGVSFVVPGVPEASDVFEISPVGLRPLQPRRVTGGTRITLDEFGLAAMILITQDPLVINQVRGRLARIERRATELAREMTLGQLAEVAELDRRLSEMGQNQDSAATWLTTARSTLARADGEFLAGDLIGAYADLERAARPVRMLLRAHWETAVSGLSSPVTSPLALVPAALPRELEFRRRLQAAGASDNLLAGGDFEILERTLKAGWQLFQYEVPGIVSRAELTGDAPHGGQSSLRLVVEPADPAHPPGLVESAPLWIRSAEVPAMAGQLFRIRCWARVTIPVHGSVDGLEVIDSLGGQALAERIGQTDGWREVTLYRVAPTSGPVSVTLALTGLGQAEIDDLSIEHLEPPTGAPAAPSQPAASEELPAQVGLRNR